MKRLITIITLLACFTIAKGQQTYFTPGVPPSSNPFSPTFRVKTTGTDSLNDLYFSIGSKWYQIYTAPQSWSYFSRRFKGSGKTTSDKVDIAIGDSSATNFNNFGIGVNSNGDVVYMPFNYSPSMSHILFTQKIDANAGLQTNAPFASGVGSFLKQNASTGLVEKDTAHYITSSAVSGLYLPLSLTQDTTVNVNGNSLSLVGASGIYKSNFNFAGTLVNLSSTDTVTNYTSYVATNAPGSQLLLGRKNNANSFATGFYMGDGFAGILVQDQLDSVGLVADVSVDTGKMGANPKAYVTNEFMTGRIAASAINLGNTDLTATSNRTFTQGNKSLEFDGSNRFKVLMSNGTDQFVLNMTPGFGQFGVKASGGAVGTFFAFDNTAGSGVVLQDSWQNIGLTYETDYSTLGSLNPRWIPDKGYIDATYAPISGGSYVPSVFGRTGAILAVSGDYNTSQVTENTNLYFTNGRVLTAPLTGFVSGAGAASSSDNVLQALQKINGNQVADAANIATNTTAIAAKQPLEDQRLSTTNSPSFVSLSLSGATANGYIDMASNSTAPSLPASSHNRVYFNNNGQFTIVGSSGKAASLSRAQMSADRVYSLPDSAGTFALRDQIAAGTLKGTGLATNLLHSSLTDFGTVTGMNMVGNVATSGSTQALLTVTATDNSWSGATGQNVGGFFSMASKSATAVSDQLDGLISTVYHYNNGSANIIKTAELGGVFLSGTSSATTVYGVDVLGQLTTGGSIGTWARMHFANDNHSNITNDYTIASDNTAPSYLKGGLTVGNGSNQTVLTPSITLNGYNLQHNTSAPIGYYGWLNLDANGNFTGTAIKGAITNAYKTNKIALLYGANATTLSLDSLGNAVSGTNAGWIIDGSGNMTIPSLNSTGIVHNSSAGLLSTSLIINADITTGTIAASKLIGTDINTVGTLSAGSIPYSLLTGTPSTSVFNRVTVTAPATGSTLTVADGKTLTANNTVTFTATDGSTLAIGGGGTLGSNAYTSTAYAPLASPSFSGTVGLSQFTANGSLANNVYVGTGNGITHQTNAIVLIQGATGVSTRDVSSGAAATLTANDSYAGHLFTGQTITTPNSGTNAIIATAAFKPTPITVTGGSTVTDHTPWISYNGTGASSEWNGWSKGGLLRMSGAQIDTLTASKVIFTDANKRMTSTGIGTSSQGIDGSGGLYSLNSKPHTIFTPTTGGTVNLTNNQYNIINPAGTLLALTVNLPSSPANNDCVFIKFTQNITTVTYANGTVVDGITAPTAGGLTVLTYDSGTTSWY